MLLADRKQHGSLSWNEPLHQEGRDDSLDRLFKDAVNSIVSARQEGRLTNEQADTLLKGIIAIMVEAKLNIIVDPVLKRALRMPIHGRKQWSDILTPFSDR